MSRLREEHLASMSRLREEHLASFKYAFARAGSRQRSAVGFDTP